jgi:hypothetical protein
VEGKAMAKPIILLEGFFCYRVVKVLYFIAFSILSILILLAGYDSRPIQYIDNANSYVACEDKSIYSFDSLDITIWDIKDKELAPYYSQKAREACSRDRYKITQKILQDYRKENPDFLSLSDQMLLDIAHTDKKFSDEPIDDYYERMGFTTASYDNYSLQLSYRTQGSWGLMIRWWALGMLVAYIALNIIRETLHYIIYGQKFTWDWLDRITKNIK